MYLVTYKVKDQSIQNTFKLYEREEVLSLVKQLNKGLTSLDWKMVDWILSLSDFSIIEHNYDQIDKHGQYFEYIKVNANWEFIEIPEYCLKINPDFIPSEKDITDKLFLEVGVLWGNDWKVSYDKWILTTFWEVFPLKTSTKYWEVFDLIYSVYANAPNSEMSYDQLRFLLEDKEYIDLTLDDIWYTPLRNVIKDKLSDIKDKYKLKTDIISLHKTKIVINYV